MQGEPDSADSGECNNTTIAPRGLEGPGGTREVSSGLPHRHIGGRSVRFRERAQEQLPSAGRRGASASD